MAIFKVWVRLLGEEFDASSIAVMLTAIVVNSKYRVLDTFFYKDDCVISEQYFTIERQKGKLMLPITIYK